LEYREQQGGGAELLIYGKSIPEAVLVAIKGKPLSSLVDLSSSDTLSWLGSPDLRIIAGENLLKRGPGGLSRYREAVYLVLQDDWSNDNWNRLPSASIEGDSPKGVTLATFIRNWQVEAFDSDCRFRVLDLPRTRYDPLSGDILFDDLTTDGALTGAGLDEAWPVFDLAGRRAREAVSRRHPSSEPLPPQAFDPETLS
jgi:hypothetical protein